jgi:hypothetical protein
MISNRGFFLLVVPILWSFASVIHFRFPGDEYAMWGVSSLAGSWVLFLVPSVGDIHQPWIRSSVAGTGALVMAAFGCVLWWLKVRILFWLVLWLISALTWLGFMLSGYPSLERALAKNGSWWAYLFSAAMMAAYTAILVSTATGFFQLFLKRFAREPAAPNSPIVPTP